MCNPSYYNASDGCDCNCGAHDPDCDLDKDVFNCPYRNMLCNNGTCTGFYNGSSVTNSTSRWSSNSTSGWSIAFGTLLSLNLVFVVIYLLYRKRRLLSGDKKQYFLLDNM